MESINLTESPITHPETAWIVSAVPLLLTVATILLFTPAAAWQAARRHCTPTWCSAPPKAPPG